VTANMTGICANVKATVYMIEENKIHEIFL